MFDLFTSEARQIMVKSREETERLRHAHIGTEHLLFALSTQYGQLFLLLGTDPDQILAEVKKHLNPNPDSVTMGKLPFTPLAERVLHLAIEETQTLGQDYLSAGHILLGLMREREGMAAKVIAHFKLEESVERLRRILGLMEKDPKPAETLASIYGRCETVSGRGESTEQFLRPLFNLLVETVKNRKPPHPSDLMLRNMTEEGASYGTRCAISLAQAGKLTQARVAANALPNKYERIWAFTKIGAVSGSALDFLTALKILEESRMVDNVEGKAIEYLIFCEVVSVQ